MRRTKCTSAMLAEGRDSPHGRAVRRAETQWHVALGDRPMCSASPPTGATSSCLERQNAEAQRSIDLISETLLSGFACIVVPEATYAIGRLERIAVAYDGSPASIRALHEALPLLSKATHVVLLCGSWPVEQPDGGPAFDPQRHLAMHGIAVEREDLDVGADEAADALLEAASRHRVDLVVAGAPGKSRFGDVHLDPIPRYLLQYASIPLYLKG